MRQQERREDVNQRNHKTKAHSSKTRSGGQAAAPAPAQAAPAAPPVWPVPAVQESKAVAAPNERDPRLEILEEGGALNRMGRPIRFNGKTGEWITADDQEPVSEDTKYVAHMVAVRHGYIKFCGEGQPPKFEMGSWYAGWKARKALGFARSGRKPVAAGLQRHRA